MPTGPDSPAELGRARPLWRRVAVPSEHGGWGLTLEPVLLGLLLAASWPGLAIGVAAFLTFLVRTPLKLALVDRRRQRSLPRTRLATRIAAVELAAIVGLGVAALVGAGPEWLIPVAAALPLVAVELWFDIRSRSRRLVPELCGAIGIAAVTAAIVVAGDGATSLAIAGWMILAARSVSSIPYVRAQIVRMHQGGAPVGVADVFSGVALLIAIGASAVDRLVLLGTVAVAALVVAQAIALRREHIPAVKVIGLRQMAAGLAVVAATAVSAAL
jgi:hypothetical protein